MTTAPLLVALDQGTTSTRAILFGTDGLIRHVARRELNLIHPANGWVEQDPEEIWRTSVEVLREACSAGEGRPVALGIANQRETVVMWDRRTGACLHNAIVWQDRRTADICEAYRAEGCEPVVTERTGLVLDPYFSATKVAWLLRNAEGVRNCGDPAFGTIDSYLLWRLTDGAVHATDTTNAARTSLFDIRRRQWSSTLLELFGVPAGLLPEVRDNACEFGTTSVTGHPLPILAMAGDQQAAAIGQACHDPGSVKATYGTGCFVLANTGIEPVPSSSRLLTTVAHSISGRVSYAVEGSIFVAGAAVQWLRDGLGVIASADETQALAESAPDNGVVFVPAFVGLGAPYWNTAARGAIFGLTRDSGPADLARAALEASAHQTADLLEAMRADGIPSDALRMDGGMAANNWFARRLADITGLPVERARVTEATAWGAAGLAGLQAGVFGSLDEIADRWQLDRRFEPRGDPTTGRRRWADAVRRTLG